MKQDIANINDITTLITLFYEYSFKDERLGNIFKEIAPLHLETHIPIVANFWNSILFDEDTYRGNVTEKHFMVNTLTPLSATDFEIWYSYWQQAVDELFEGELAEKAKLRAKSIANIMSYKMDFINNNK